MMPRSFPVQARAASAQCAAQRAAQRAAQCAALCAALVVLVATGCGREAPGPAPVADAPARPPGPTPSNLAPPQAAAAAEGRAIHFTDVTAESGLDATTTSGVLPSTQILEVKGAGLALFDMDGDGDLDVLMPNGATLASPDAGPGARIFENVGGLRFRDATDSSGVAHRRWSFGTAVGDVDADGREDIYICCFGPDVLLRNVTEPGGPIRFEDITAASGIKDDLWSAAAAMGDLDADGDLDLFVTTYLHFDPANPPGPTIFKSIPVMSGPVGLPAAKDILYENLGGGRFRDVSESAGIHRVAPSYGLNTALLDLTGDGRPDIYVGNDSDVNNLFRNLGPRDAAEGASRLAFEDVGLSSGIGTNIEGTEQATMGVAIADVDGNGRPDVFTTNFSSDTNTLHMNLDGKFFEDRTQQYGLGAVSRPYLGWATAFVDFDHDGDEDLIVFNGHVYPQASRSTMDSDYEQAPLLFERRGKRFERLLPEVAGEWLSKPHRDRSAVFGDLDGDGDVDMIVAELNGPLRVLRNDRTAAGSDDGSWLIVQLDDARTPGNRRGLGAIVECRTGDLVQRRWIWGGGPFMSNALPVAHFGLPTPGPDAEVTVIWPDGERTTSTVGRGVVRVGRK